MTDRTRTIVCMACDQSYEVTRMFTVEDTTVLIEEPTLLGTAYCPNCGKRADVMQQGVDDASR